MSRTEYELTITIDFIVNNGRSEVGLVMNGQENKDKHDLLKKSFFNLKKDDGED